MPKLTPYQKEIRNLKRRIKTAEKAGYIFPEEIKIPRSSKKVHELRGNKLYEKATGYTSKYGEYYEKPPTIQQKRAIEKEEREFYGDFRDTPDYEIEEEKQYINKELLIHTYQLLEIFDINSLSDYGSSKVSKRDIQKSENQKQLMLNLLNAVVAEQGEDAVAERLNNNTTASEINEIVNEALNTYKKSDTEIAYYFNEFAELITGRPFTPSDAQRYSNDSVY